MRPIFAVSAIMPSGLVAIFFCGRAERGQKNEAGQGTEQGRFRLWRNHHLGGATPPPLRGPPQAGTSLGQRVGCLCCIIQAMPLARRIAETDSRVGLVPVPRSCSVRDIQNVFARPQSAEPVELVGG